jgi:hypothetical protein
MYATAAHPLACLRSCAYEFHVPVHPGEKREEETINELIWPSKYMVKNPNHQGGRRGTNNITFSSLKHHFSFIFFIPPSALHPLLSSFLLCSSSSYLWILDLGFFCGSLVG